MNQNFDRIDVWQRKLLDMTMRNVMLNLRTTKTIVPLNEGNPEKIVTLLRRNRLANIIGRDKDNRLEILKKLYRESHHSLNENGTNTLYVSLGTLKWYEKDSSTARNAPLIFIPLEIVRSKTMLYEVRMLDDDPILNVTLLEMIRREFGVTFPELSPIPMLEQEPVPENGRKKSRRNSDLSNELPDWKKIFKILSYHIKTINDFQPYDRKWEITMQSYIGLFSFTKFLMWHDINEHDSQVRAHELLGDLSQNRQIINTQEPLKADDIESSSTQDLIFPIDYDSSQLLAIAEADRGTSFVLHGPPGTGKSQTITNIIANALYKGKRVLFVSEKKAALEVVQSRLSKIGLDPFCLELHSKKTQKNAFIEQLKKAEIGNLKNALTNIEHSNSYEKLLHRFQDYLKRLGSPTSALHTKNEDGMSLYDYISASNKIEGELISLTDAEIFDLTLSELLQLIEICRQLDTVEEILGKHPSKSPLLGLYPYNNTIDAQHQLEDSLKGLSNAILKVRKKASGIINKWFLKHTPEHYLEKRLEWSELQKLASVDIPFDIDIIDKNVNKWSDAASEMRNWNHFAERALELRKKVPTIFNYYLEGCSGTEAADTLSKSYYTPRALKIVENTSILRGFHGLLHEKDLMNFRKDDNLLRESSTQVLVEEILNNIRKIELSEDELKELTLLERRIYNRGFGVSLREIMKDSRHILHKLFPCMLMSPLSVAQFLDMEPGLFDVVIFDEASQMETPDSIGAIARGKQTIIVGDPKQLPPTTFFNVGQGSENEDLENQDADSILEDALAIGMPSLYLTRHYRSRHESLIACSNYMFYDGKLITFPSVNDAERKVTHIDPHGEYDYGKTRTNVIEAQAIVDYIIKRLENENGEEVPSIGVVTFSKTQSNLIEELLSSALSYNIQASTNLERCKEPIFVKNLETVQGDERDIVIFSVGYGPDKDGKVSLNFGPLNKQGGERRLNVAITRAKSEMIVFSSLLPCHIPESTNMAKGVSALRSFIEFSINGTLHHFDLEDSRHHDDLVEKIAEKLREKGLKVKNYVGRSDFRIDLAVTDVNNPESYCLGIIIDGMNYNSLPTIRDREITVPAVLNNLGWKLFRIWTVDWVIDPDSIIKRIMQTVNPEPEPSNI